MLQIAAALAVIDLGRLDFLRRVSGVEQGLLGHFQRLFAIRANAAHQALRANQVHRSRHQERLNTHVHQAADGGGRVIGVQGGKHQVAGERGFHGDFRRFKVANFADQNDVGVLPQEGAQRRGEIQPDLILHLHLVDARQLEFDRVFGGHDVGVGRIQARDGRNTACWFCPTR